MDRNNLYQLLRNGVILGNVLFIVWISFNAIDEGFAGTIYQKLSYIGLVFLLLFNIGFLSRKK